jgi:hypothetical protein
MTRLDDVTCQTYFLVLTKKAVERYRKIDFDESDLSKDDLVVVEYILKDGAKRPISEFANQEECAHIFIERIKRLSEGDREEWLHFRDRIARSARYLTPAQFLDLDYLALRCRSKKSK